VQASMVLKHDETLKHLIEVDETTHDAEAMEM